MKQRDNSWILKVWKKGIPDRQPAIRNFWWVLNCKPFTMGVRKRQRGHSRLSLRQEYSTLPLIHFFQNPQSKGDAYGAYLSFTALCLITLQCFIVCLFVCFNTNWKQELLPQRDYAHFIAVFCNWPTKFLTLACTLCSFRSKGQMPFGKRPNH